MAARRQRLVPPADGQRTEVDQHATLLRSLSSAILLPESTRAQITILGFGAFAGIATRAPYSWDSRGLMSLVELIRPPPNRASSTNEGEYVASTSGTLLSLESIMSIIYPSALADAVPAAFAVPMFFTLTFTTMVPPAGSKLG